MKKFLIYLIAPFVLLTGIAIGAIAATTGLVDPHDIRGLTTTQILIAGSLLGLAAIAIGTTATKLIQKAADK